MGVYAGGPGVGKQTQSEMIIETFDFVLLQPDHLIKLESQEETKKGIELAAIVEQSRDVPQDILITTIKDYILKDVKTAQGYVICDFPKTVQMGQEFEKEICKVTAILYLRASTRTMRERSLNKIHSKKLFEILNNTMTPTPTSEVRKEPRHMKMAVKDTDETTHGSKSEDDVPSGSQTAQQETTKGETEKIQKKDNRKITQFNKEKKGGPSSEPLVVNIAAMHHLLKKSNSFPLSFLPNTSDAGAPLSALKTQEQRTDASPCGLGILTHTIGTQTSPRLPSGASVRSQDNAVEAAKESQMSVNTTQSCKKKVHAPTEPVIVNVVTVRYGPEGSQSSSSFLSSNDRNKGVPISTLETEGGTSDIGIRAGAENCRELPLGPENCPRSSDTRTSVRVHASSKALVDAVLGEPKRSHTSSNKDNSSQKQGRPFLTPNPVIVNVVTVRQGPKKDNTASKPRSLKDVDKFVSSSATKKREKKTDLGRGTNQENSKNTSIAQRGNQISTYSTRVTRNQIKSSGPKPTKIVSQKPEKDISLKPGKHFSPKHSKTDGTRSNKDDTTKRTKIHTLKQGITDNLKVSKHDNPKPVNINSSSGSKSDHAKRTKDDNVKRTKDDNAKRTKDDNAKRTKDDNVKRTKDDNAKRTKIDSSKQIPADNSKSSKPIKSESANTTKALRSGQDFTQNFSRTNMETSSKAQTKLKPKDGKQTKKEQNSNDNVKSTENKMAKSAKVIKDKTTSESTVTSKKTPINVISSKEKTTKSTRKNYDDSETKPKSLSKKTVTKPRGRTKPKIKADVTNPSISDAQTAPVPVRADRTKHVSTLQKEVIAASDPKGFTMFWGPGKSGSTDAQPLRDSESEESSKGYERMKMGTHTRQDRMSGIIVNKAENVQEKKKWEKTEDEEVVSVDSDGDIDEIHGDRPVVRNSPLYAAMTGSTDDEVSEEDVGDGKIAEIEERIVNFYNNKTAILQCYSSCLTQINAESPTVVIFDSIKKAINETCDTKKLLYLKTTSEQ